MSRSKKTLSRTVAGAVALVASLLLHAAPAAAQDIRVSPNMVVRIPDVPTIMDDFQKQMHDPNHAPGGGMGHIIFVLRRWHEFPAKADSLLGDLERLALRSDHERTRVTAAGLIARAAWQDLEHPRPGTLGRLLGVYRQTRDPMVRYTVVGRLIWISERGPAIAFLKQLATQTEAEEDFRDAAEEAIWHLALMGEEGRTALRELHQKKLVKDSWARYKLDDLAKRGFRLPE